MSNFYFYYFTVFLIDFNVLFQIFSCLIIICISLSLSLFISIPFSPALSFNLNILCILYIYIYILYCDITLPISLSKLYWRGQKTISAGVVSGFSGEDHLVLMWFCCVFPRLIYILKLTLMSFSDKLWIFNTFPYEREIIWFYMSSIWFLGRIRRVSTVLANSPWPSWGSRDTPVITAPLYDFGLELESLRSVIPWEFEFISPS